jgi:6-phosphogluconolactonase (cycloisomerase 2 family)
MVVTAHIDAQLERLHDAVLVGIEIRWADGIATVTLRVPAGVERIVIEQMTLARCPRSFDWGRSASVNTARIEEGSQGLHLEIEMQSGDVLVFDAAAVRVESVD